MKIRIEIEILDQKGQSILKQYISIPSPANGNELWDIIAKGFPNILPAINSNNYFLFVEWKDLTEPNIRLIDDCKVLLLNRSTDKILFPDEPTTDAPSPEGGK